MVCLKMGRKRRESKESLVLLQSLQLGTRWNLATMPSEYEGYTGMIIVGTEACAGDKEERKYSTACRPESGSRR